MYVLDTSAWIEYFKDSDKSWFIDKLIDDGEIFTPTIVLAELSTSFFHKFKKKDVLEWKLLSNFVSTKSELVPMNKEICEFVGMIKKEKRKTNSKISTADCIIIATSRWADSKILTTDKDILDEDSATDLNELS